MTVTINLTRPGFASIVTGVGACIVDALEQTPAGTPCRQCLLVPSSQIVWDNCGPCEHECSGQVAQAITSIYGSDSFPTAAGGLNWAKQRCTPRWWVASVTAVVTRCLPAIHEDGTSPSCDDELAAGLMLVDDATAVRQAIACCLQSIYEAEPARLGVWSLGGTTILPELGGCGGTSTEFLIGVQACPCSGG